MSESDPAEVSLVATRDGVRVEKTFEPDDFPVPAIAFGITSERDEPVEVRITDGVPDPVDPQDIGFHPKYGAEFWSVEDDHIVFERSFEPGEEYTTVYGLRSETDSVEQYLSDPTIDRVDPPLADGDDALDLADPDAEEDDAGAAAASGSDREDATDDGDEGGTDGLAGPTGPSIPENVGAGTDGDAVVLAEGELAETMASELRAGEVSDETIEVLREALGVEASGSAEARIERIQSDVSDLRAYRDALEEFLDENGDAQQVLDRVEERTEELSENVATLRADADRHGERLDEFEAELSTLDDEVETLESDVDALEETVDDVEGEVDDVEGEVDDLREVEAQLDDVRDDIEALAEMRERLSSVFGAGSGAGSGDDDENDAA